MNHKKKRILRNLVTFKIYYPNSCATRNTNLLGRKGSNMNVAKRMNLGSWRQTNFIQQGILSRTKIERQGLATFMVGSGRYLY